MKETGLVFLGVTILVLMINGAIFFSRWMASEGEETRRHVYEHSAAYNQGVLRDLRSYCFEYAKATTPAEKTMIAGAIRHLEPQLGNADLKPEDRACLEEARK